MPLTGTVDAANARIDLFVDYTTEVGTTTDATIYRRVGSPTADIEYVRGMFGSTLLGEQGYASDHEAPLDAQVWYIVVSSTGPSMTAGPFTIPSGGFVWLKDPGRPWADLKLDLCTSPSRGEAECPDELVAVADSFSRTSANGWGTADTGQAWSVTGGAASDYSVSGGTGRQTHPAINTLHYSVIPSPAADISVVSDWMMPVAPTGDSNYVFFFSRYTDTNHFYFVRVQVAPGGVMTLTLRKRNGAETQVGSSVVSLHPFVAGAWYRVRFETRGQTLRARLWPRDQAETESWDITANDSDLNTAGSVGVRSLMGSSSTLAVPYTFEFDNFAAYEFAPASVDIAWVGFRDKQRAADAGLFPVLDAERPADVFARRKDITTGIMFLSRALDAITAVYELFTAGGPLLVQVPSEYGMNAPYGQRDRYYQPGDLDESYLSQDQRKVYRLWSAPATAVNAPIGEPQGTDTANWCALMETYPTMGAYAASGYTWAQAATGAATTIDLPGLYGSGPYGSGPYGG